MIGKPATSASFAVPQSVAIDANGNLYVGDSTNCRIRRVNTRGVISTYAGTGICSFSGDGGPAKTAMINFPAALAFDSLGNLLFADQGNSRIRKISAAGTITTVAGNGTAGYSGDGGQATLATLRFPWGASVDPFGKIYIADSSNFVIRMVDTSGIIHTVAGNHTSGFSGDGGPATSAQIGFSYNVLADGSGNFYIPDSNNERVRKVDATGTITTYAGNGMFGNGGNGGPATAASIGSPQGLLLKGGKLYIGTGSNIWTVDLTTQLIEIIAGSANGSFGFSGDGNPALSTSFNSLRGLASDAAGNLFIADSGNNRVRKIDSGQIVTTMAGGFIGDGGAGTAASLNPIYFGGHLAFDPSGNLYVADSSNNRIRKVSPTGTITTLAGTGITGYSGDGGPASAATISQANGVAVDPLGNVFIGDTNNNVIRKIDPSGTITTFAKNFGQNIIFGLATDAIGNVYAVDFVGPVIWKITPSGSASIVAGVHFHYGYNGDGIPATQAWLNLPTSVAVDSAGNLYISDWANQRIRKVDTSGIITTVAGNGTFGFGGDGGPATAAMLCQPLDVATDAKGNLYIADSCNGRVRIVDSSGTIQTLAGSGGFGYNGNGLPAKSTNMFPVAVAVNPKGLLYVNDLESYRVRKVH